MSKVNIDEIMKRAQEMQSKLKDIQKQVAEMEIIGQSGGDMVRITMTGQHYAKKVYLNPSLLKEDKSVIEDLIAAAINDAADKIERGLSDKMGSITGDSLPKDFNLPED